MSKKTNSWPGKTTGAHSIMALGIVLSFSLIVLLTGCSNNNVRVSETAPATSPAVNQTPPWVQQEKERAKTIEKTNVVQAEITEDVTTIVDWENRYIEVIAEGTALDCPSPAACRIQAEEIARTRAYKILASTLDGLHVSAETTVKDEVKLGSITVTKLKTFLQGARVMNTSYHEFNGEIIASVVIGFVMDGENSFGELVIPPYKERLSKNPPIIFVPGDIEPPSPATQEPKPDSEPETVPTPAPEEENDSRPQHIATPLGTGNHTGLIVDARGLGLKPAMSPQIITQGGEAVYGVMTVDPDFAISIGIVSYAKDVDRAKSLTYINEKGEKSLRVGDKPLFVKAIGIDGKFEANAVVTAEVATEILYANRTTSFLENCAVVFLTD